MGRAGPMGRGSATLRADLFHSLARTGHARPPLASPNTGLVVTGGGESWPASVC
jgi:hypothetical protein